MKLSEYKSGLLTYIFSLAIMLPLFTFSSMAQEKINIAIVDFDAQNVPLTEASVVSDFIRTNLVRIGKFRVVERRRMELILTEQGFQQTGCTTSECAVQIGKILNVEKIIVGKLVKSFCLYYIMADMIDVETGEIVLSRKASCEDPQLLEEEAEKITWYFASDGRKEDSIELKVKMVRRFPMVTKLTREKDSIWIELNRGSLDGLKKGEIYEIWHSSNKILGGKIGKVIIKDIKPVLSRGKIISTTINEEIKTGDCLVIDKKIKKWGAGLKIGPVIGHKGDGDCFALFYNYMDISGWGFQINLGFFDRNKRRFINGVKYFEEITYGFPFFLNYRLNYKYISTYFGIGLSMYENKLSPSISPFYGYTPNKESGIAFPIINIGCDLFAAHLFHIVIEGTYFRGAKPIAGFSTDYFVTSAGISFNW